MLDMLKEMITPAEAIIRVIEYDYHITPSVNGYTSGYDHAISAFASLPQRISKLADDQDALKNILFSLEARCDEYINSYARLMHALSEDEDAFYLSLMGRDRMSHGKRDMIKEVMRRNQSVIESLKTAINCTTILTIDTGVKP